MSTNSANVVNLAQQILGLRRRIETREREANVAFGNHSETSIARGGLTAHFEQVIQTNFSEGFWAHLTATERGLRNTRVGEAHCITRILNQVRALILDAIINSPTFEAAATIVWVTANRDVLIDPTHARHDEVLTASRGFLNSYTNPRHTAWRNFDPGAPRDPNWTSLFAGGGANFQCQQWLAYYYVVIHDNRQTAEAMADGRVNFIRILADTRRAHNDGSRNSSPDSPSCYSGTVGRLPDMGQFHPVARLPLSPLERLPYIFNSILAPCLRRVFRLDNSYEEKTNLYKALMDMDLYADSIPTNAVLYPDDLLAIRNRFINEVGSLTAVTTIVENQLRSLNCDRINLNVNEQEILRLMLLDPCWRTGAVTVRDMFISSMSNVERTRFNSETGEALPLENATVVVQVTVEPFPETTYESQLATLIRISPTTMPREAIIRRALRNYNSNRINRIIYPILVREGVERTAAQSVTEEISGEITTAGQTTPTSTLLETRLRGPLSHLTADRMRQLMTELNIIFSTFVFITTPPTQTQSPTVSVSPATLTSPMAMGTFNIVRAGIFDRPRASLGVRTASPYAQIGIPCVPVIQPYHPVGSGPANGRVDGGIPTYSIAATLPGSATATDYPDGLERALTERGMTLADLSVFFCVQNIPWQNEQLLLRPHAWLHANAPDTGNHQDTSHIFISMADLQGGFDQGIDNVEVQTHSDFLGRRVEYSPNNMAIRGREIENLQNTQAFYSLCIDRASRRAALTLHWLLNDQDHTLTSRIIQEARTQATVTTLQSFLQFMNQAVAPTDNPANGTLRALLAHDTVLNLALGRSAALPRIAHQNVYCVDNTVIVNLTPPSVGTGTSLPVTTPLTMADLTREREALQRWANQTVTISTPGYWHNRRLTIGVENTGPYSTIGVPRVPIIHPYHPTGEVAGNARIEGGVPYISMAMQLPRGTLSNLPEGVQQQLIERGLNPVNNLDAFFCVQNRPWRNEALLLRPHGWLHPTAPDSSTANYEQSSTISAGLANMVSGFSRLESNIPVQTHNSGGGANSSLSLFGWGLERNQVLFSPNNLSITGINDHTTHSHCFYSLCVDVSTHRAALTLHWLLNDGDNAQVRAIVNGCAAGTTFNTLLTHFRHGLDNSVLNNTYGTPIERSPIDELESFVCGIQRPIGVLQNASSMISLQSTPITQNVGNEPDLFGSAQAIERARHAAETARLAEAARLAREANERAVREAAERAAREATERAAREAAERAQAEAAAAAARTQAEAIARAQAEVVAEAARIEAARQAAEAARAAEIAQLSQQLIAARAARNVAECQRIATLIHRR